MFQGVRVPAVWFRFGLRARQTNDAPLQNPEIDTHQSLLRTMIWMMISLIEKVTCLNHQTREKVWPNVDINLSNSRRQLKSLQIIKKNMEIDDFPRKRSAFTVDVPYLCISTLIYYVSVIYWWFGYFIMPILDRQISFIVVVPCRWYPTFSCVFIGFLPCFGWKSRGLRIDIQKDVICLVPWKRTVPPCSRDGNPSHLEQKIGCTCCKHRWAYECWDAPRIWTPVTWGKLAQNKWPIESYSPLLSQSD